MRLSKEKQVARESITSFLRLKFNSDKLDNFEDFVKDLHQDKRDGWQRQSNDRVSREFLPVVEFPLIRENNQ